MNAKLAELARRRESLTTRSAVQREQLVQAYRELQKSVGIVQRLAGAIRTVKAHPAAAVGLTAFLLSTRRGRLAKLPELLGIGLGILRLFHAWRSPRKT